jgi:hypothetical protein
MEGWMLRRRVVAVLLMSAATVPAWPGAAGFAAGPSAHAARRLTLHDSADLHLVRKSGPILHERGTARGTLPGSVSATFNTRQIAKTTGTVTFHAAGGTITASVVGYAKSLTRFTGSLAVRSGTGRYARAFGGGPISGSVNRRTWHVTVHTSSIILSY